METVLTFDRWGGEWFELPDKDAQALHALQPDACAHTYQQYKRLQAKWRQDEWGEWRTYYDAYLEKTNAEFQRMQR